MRLDPWKLLTELPGSKTPTIAALTLALAAATGRSRVVVANELSKLLRGKGCVPEKAAVYAVVIGCAPEALLSGDVEWEASFTALRMWNLAGRPMRPWGGR